MRTSPRTWPSIFGAALAALWLAGSARAVDADKYTPADADVVISINVRRIVDSPVFQKYGKADAVQGIQNPQVSALLTALGLDPLKDVDSIQLTSAGNLAANPKVLLVARGKFNVAKISSAAKNYAAANPTELKITPAGPLTIYEGTQKGQTIYAHLTPDGAALLASTDKGYLTQAVTVPSPGPNQALKNALAKVPSTKDAVWMAAVFTDSMKQQLAALSQLTKKAAPTLEVMTGSIDVTDDVVARLVVHTAGPNGANDVKGLLDQGKALAGLMVDPKDQFFPLAQSLLENLDITKDKNNDSVKLTLTVTADLLKKADKLKNPDNAGGKDK